jgi:hypothetical protein
LLLELSEILKDGQSGDATLRHRTLQLLLVISRTKLFLFSAFTVSEHAIGRQALASSDLLSVLLDAVIGQHC